MLNKSIQAWQFYELINCHPAMHYQESYNTANNYLKTQLINNIEQIYKWRKNQ